MNYEQTGVSLQKAHTLIEKLAGIIPDKNSFGGIFNLPFSEENSLVVCCDGIGTKIIPLLERKEYKTIANDLAAANLNDLCCSGAQPLLFLDYISVNKLDVEAVYEILKHLKNILFEHHCMLIGGETSEMKDIIKEDIMDMAGFAVGYTNNKTTIGPHKVKNGDIIIALSSTGAHTNGFSLLRKLYEEGQISEKDFSKSLSPSNIYSTEILKLVKDGLISACAHITGGGVESNLKRIIPKGLCAELDRKEFAKDSLWQKLIMILGEKESFDVYNMGAGMIIICSEEYKQEVLDICKLFSPFIAGRVVENEKNSCIWLR